jgi:hypothetical protein
MSASPPAAGEPPNRRDPTAPIPEEVWDRFLTDTEERIRASAPREPSAGDRLARRPPVVARADPAATGSRRRTAVVWRYVRPVLVLLLIAAIALLTFRPDLVLSWAAGSARPAVRGPAGTPCSAARYNAGCRAGELPWNSGFRTSAGVVRVVR